MAESASLLVDEVLPHRPMRQWVLSVPFPLRFLFARQPAVMGKVLGIVYRVIAMHLTHKAGYTKAKAHAGAVTQIQCFDRLSHALADLNRQRGRKRGRPAGNPPTPRSIAGTDSPESAQLFRDRTNTACV